MSRRRIAVNHRDGLKYAICTCKRECFKELFADEDLNPWGIKNRVIMKKMNGRILQVTCTHLFLYIVVPIFPRIQRTAKSINKRLMRFAKESAIMKFAVKIRPLQEKFSKFRRKRL